MSEVKKLVRKKNRVWRNKDYAFGFNGAYVFVLNRKTKEYERKLRLTEVGISKPTIKNSHFFDSPEAAKKVGWKGSDK